MRLKTLIVETTKHVPPLYRALSRFFHSTSKAFVLGNSGAPDAISDALEQRREA